MNTDSRVGATASQEGSGDGLKKAQRPCPVTGPLVTGVINHFHKWDDPPSRGIIPRYTYFRWVNDNE